MAGNPSRYGAPKLRKFFLREVHGRAPRVQVSSRPRALTTGWSGEGRGEGGLGHKERTF